MSGIAAAWLRHPNGLVGSAGLTRPRRRAEPAAVVPPDGPVVIVAGSLTATTRVQLDRIVSRERVIVLRTPPTEARDAGKRLLAWPTTCGASRPRCGRAPLSSPGRHRALAPAIGSTLARCG
jgi:hypothetical protein